MRINKDVIDKEVVFATAVILGLMVGSMLSVAATHVILGMHCSNVTAIVSIIMFFALLAIFIWINPDLSNRKNQVVVAAVVLTMIMAPVGVIQYHNYMMEQEMKDMQQQMEAAEPEEINLGNYTEVSPEKYNLSRTNLTWFITHDGQSLKNKETVNFEIPNESVAKVWVPHDLRREPAYAGIDGTTLSLEGYHYIGVWLEEGVHSVTVGSKKNEVPATYYPTNYTLYLLIEDSKNKIPITLNVREQSCELKIKRCILNTGCVEVDQVAEVSDVFKLCNFTPNKTYNLSLGGEVIDTSTANSNGCIVFNMTNNNSKH